MKVSQAIQSFQEYHRLNSKKKYAEELRVHFQPISGGIWR